MAVITAETIARTIDFDTYLALTKAIVASTDPQGKYANPNTHRYTSSNLERMEKVLQYMVLNQKLYNALDELQENWIWLVLTEPWCGDASWGTPALYIIAAACGHIDFKLLLRDENPEIMQEYQTAGSDSIPKLICLRKSDLSEVGTWGPRPQILQQVVQKQRSEPGWDYRESVRALHSWYEQDMTKSIQDELLDLVKEWKKK